MGAIGAALLLAPLGQRHANAAMSLTVTPPAVPATTDAVTLSGECDGASETDGGITYPGSVVVTLDDGTSQQITLERGSFTDVRFGLPDGLTGGEHRFSTALSPEFADSYPACDPGATLTILPPEIAPTLDIDRDRGEVGGVVTATGTCPTATRVAVVRFDDEIVGRSLVDRSTGVFGPVTFQVPDVPPDGHVITSGCGSRRPFQVLPPRPATLRLEPRQGTAGSTLMATGVCPASATSVTVSLADEAVGPAPVDPGTGAFGPLSITVPDVGLGPVPVRTDCGAQSVFTVAFRTAPATPITTPPITTPPTPTPASTTVQPSPSTATPPTATVTTDGLRIVVPDLSGMTEAEAVAALGDRLTLANPTGGTGQVSSQLPPPGTLVEPASAVSVVLAPLRDQPNRLPVVVAVLAAGVLVGALVQVQRLRRRRARQDHWLHEDVRTELQAEQQVLSAVPDQAVTGVDVRLEVHRDPARLDFQEVGGAHD